MVKGEVKPKPSREVCTQETRPYVANSFLFWKIGLPKSEIMGWSYSGSLRLTWYTWYGILGLRGALRWSDLKSDPHLLNTIYTIFAKSWGTSGAENSPPPKTDCCIFCHLNISICTRKPDLM